MWLTLTLTSDGQPVDVNFSNVTHYLRNTDSYTTFVRFAENNYLYVVETPDEIRAKLILLKQRT